MPSTKRQNLFSYFFPISQVFIKLLNAFLQKMYFSTHLKRLVDLLNWIENSIGLLAKSVFSG